jgi:hypothetical protein
MKTSHAIVLLSCFVAGSSVSAHAQSVFNPDISIISRFRFESNDGQKLPEERAFSKPEFTFEEFEVAIQSYLNPYARADVFLAKGGAGEEPIEIEEAYATFLKGLPLDLNIRIGKYLTEFGKLNTMHPHSWSFLSKPLSLQRFLGEEGINDLGISASILIPAGDVVYAKLTADVLRGHTIGTLDPTSHTQGGGVGMIDTASSEVFYANSGRLMVFVPVSENGDLELGVSGLTGIHDPYARLRFTYANIDFKYKWKPNAYTSLVLQGEALFNHRKISRGTDIRGRTILQSFSSQGFYLYGNLQFNKVFTVGGRFDWTQSPYSTHEKAQGGAVFVGFYPVEETAAFRLQYEHVRTTSPGAATIGVNTISLQFMFSMGPHKAHPF